MCVIAAHGEESQLVMVMQMVAAVEKQMVMVAGEKQMGKLETGATRPPDATTWARNLIPGNENFVRQRK